MATQLSQLSGDDKAELIALWLRNPYATVFEIAEQLEKRIGKKLDVRVISKGMELLGLNKVSEKKKTELARNNKSQPERSYK